MKKNRLSGCKTVFDFTFHQAAKKKGYRVVTFLVSFLLIAAIIAAIVISSIPDKDEQKKTEPIAIKTVYILDQSGLEPMDYKGLLTSQYPVRYAQTEFVTSEVSSRDEVIQQALSTDQSVAVVITKLGKDYQLETIPLSGITTSDSKEIMNDMAQVFQAGKIQQAGLTAEQLQILLTPTNSEILEIGEDSNFATELIKIFAPMMFGLLLYMMFLFYGQTVSREVSTEKTSKLMENLLTSVSPDALITGKILAISLLAIIQVAIWIVSIIIGLYAGNAIAQSMHPEYKNVIVTIIDFLRQNIGENALSLPSIIIAFLIFCIGFVFYAVLAGVSGCMVSRPEDVASSQGYFVLPIMLSWAVCYFGSAAENQTLMSVVRYIPFTIPFSTPIDVMVGTISIAESLIGLAILLAFSFFFISLAARIYRGLVLYNGNKINFKVIGKILKTQK